MIRTTISICALLGGLLLLSLMMHEARAQDISASGPDVSLNAPQTSDASQPAAEGDESVRVAERTDDRAAQSVLRRPAELDEREEIGSEELDILRDRIRDCLTYHFQRPEDASRRSPWGVMHALIAYGVDTDILAGGQKVNAIGWLCWNRPCNGQKLLGTSNGRLLAHQGPGVQGHHGQFLAMLAQSRVADEYMLKVDGKEFTVADLIEYEKQGCEPKSELTFKLIGLSHYLPSDATWTNRHGDWDIERLIREELAQPVIGAACGGTHRMMGFSYAIKQRKKEDKPIEGQWLRAEKFVNDFHDYTFRLQNRDGSFSTNWFEGRGSSPDIDRRLQTTGHILEWLIYSLPEEQLRERRMVRSVDYLTRLMLQNPSHSWEIGPKGHALHALVLYDQKVFGNDIGKGVYRVARSDETE
ncbi:MAG: hypothetical protein RIC55_17415 [Pirellulaceae bacterium]